MASMARWLRLNYIAVGTSIVVIVIVLFLVWPLLFGGTASAPALPSAGTSSPAVASSSIPVPAPAAVHLLVIAGTSTIIDDAVSGLLPGENAFVLLKDEAAKDKVQFISKSYPGMGDLVTSIGGFASGSGQNYWQYTVNGKYVPVGADGYVPQSGDSIVWKFTTSQE
jgi:hypothetical protein